MASDAHARFSSFLLRQSDWHPIRTITGEDLAEFDPKVVREFEQNGLVVQLRDLRDADGVVFGVNEDVAEDDCACAWASSIADGEVARVSPLALKRYRIEFEAVAAYLRRRLELVGPPIEEVNPRIRFLGALGSGGRRKEVYLVRCLRAEQALQPLLSVRAHAGETCAIIVLALGSPELPRSVMRQIGDMQILALQDLISARESVPLAVCLPLAQGSESPEPETARLVIDVGGSRATLDGGDLDVERRDFATLTVLANEASADGGFVTREAIWAAMRGATQREANDEQVTGSISRLRRALRRIDPAIDVVNKRTVGYRLQLLQGQIDLR